MTLTDITPSAVPPDDDNEPRWKRWRRRFMRRAEPDCQDVVSAELVKWQRREEEGPKVEGWGWVEKHSVSLPDKREVQARLKHAAPKVPGIIGKFVFKTAPVTVLREIKPVWSGGGKVAAAIGRWITATHLEEAAKHSEGALKSRQHADRHKAHGYRVWSLLIGGALATGGMFYLYYLYNVAFWVTIAIITCALDLIGRKDQKPAELAPRYREPLSEGMAYKQLTASIQAAFNEIVGVDTNGIALVRMDGVCNYESDREEWRQHISTYQEIDPEKHIRALERAIGAKPRSIRLLEIPESATRRIVTIKNGDPFKVVPTSPWRDTNSKSITEGLLLGASQAEHPFLIHIAGVHVGIVAASGGGKSEGVISAIIDGILATYNAVIVGVDLTEGPLFPIWGDCIQRVAYTPEAADELLDWLLAEIKERATILGDIARSDDPNVKGREWNADLAAKYNKPSIHLIIDELPQATKFNGQPRGTIDLAGKFEVVARTGSKHWITLITGAQKTGKSDSGSTGLSSQIMAWLVGPCTQDDANEIFSPDLRRAGWAPNLLHPAVRGKAKNDAGRVYVKAAGFGPDVYCSWSPMPEEEIKRRRARRLAEGIPTLDTGDDVIEATTVPNTLSALAAAMDEIDPPDGFLPSKMAAEWISTHTSQKMTQAQLADGLKKELGDKAPRAKSTRNKLGGNCSCYRSDEINVAMEEL